MDPRGFRTSATFFSIQEALDDFIDRRVDPFDHIHPTVLHQLKLGLALFIQTNAAGGIENALAPAFADGTMSL
jgi:hypothetical protein